MKVCRWIGWRSLIVMFSLIAGSMAEAHEARLPGQEEMRSELSQARQAEVRAKMAAMPIPFIENQGQVDEDVFFLRQDL